MRDAALADQCQRLVRGGGSDNPDRSLQPVAVFPVGGPEAAQPAVKAPACRPIRRHQYDGSAGTGVIGDPVSQSPLDEPFNFEPRERNLSVRCDRRHKLEETGQKHQSRES